MTKRLGCDRLFLDLPNVPAQRLPTTFRTQPTISIRSVGIGVVIWRSLQVWQAVGAEQSDNAVSRELFRLNMAAQPIQDDGGSTSRAE